MKQSTHLLYYILLIVAVFIARLFWVPIATIYDFIITVLAFFFVLGIVLYKFKKL